MNLLWWRKRKPKQLKIEPAQVWHIFELRTPPGVSEMTKYEYIDTSTKTADEDEDYELKKFKGKKKK